MSDVWFSLMTNKKILAKTIHEVIAKNMLTEEQLNDPQIANLVNMRGRYEIETKRSENEIEALDILTGLGYVQKKKDKIYRVALIYIAHPYVPQVNPGGGLGIHINNKSSRTCFDFNEREYRFFVQTTKQFKDEIRSGSHSHITLLDYRIIFNYETDVYEVEDDFFDAISLIITKNGELAARLSEPYILSKYQGKEETETKNWKFLKQISGKRFLQGKQELLNVVKELPWKKDIIGMIKGYDQRIYNITKVDPTNKIRKKTNSSQMFFNIPSFFGHGLYSYENTISRIFEDAVAEYLREKEKYITTVRFTPKYLRKEIDIFGERGTKKFREIMICECKFRFNNNKITKDEIEWFLAKCVKIKKVETKNDVHNFKFWFVTTTDQIEPDADKFLKKTKIEFKQAILPQSWQKRADWSISKIS